MPLAEAEEVKTLSPGDWVSEYTDKTSAGDPGTRLILLPHKYDQQPGNDLSLEI